MMQDYGSFFSQVRSCKVSYTEDEAWDDFLPEVSKPKHFERMQESLRRQFISQIVPAEGTRTDSYGVQEHRRAERTDRTFVDADYIMPIPVVTFRQFRITPREALQRAWETTAEQFGHISVSRNVMNGEPRIAGTRIPVSIIVSMVGEGYTFDQIAEDYGNVSVEEVREAVLFAARLTW